MQGISNCNEDLTVRTHLTINKITQIGMIVRFMGDDKRELLKSILLGFFLELLLIYIYNNIFLRHWKIHVILSLHGFPVKYTDQLLNYLCLYDTLIQ